MERTRFNRIIGLALPIVGGMVSQSVLNLVDTAMVGALGRDALAGVGTASFAVFMATALVMGLSSGVQAISARRIGEGRGGEAAVPLTGGLLLALVIGIPVTVMLTIWSSALLPFLNDDGGVIEAGRPYFDARLLGVVAVGVNFSFRGYWTGTNQSRRYFQTLLIVHVANVGISYVLIFGKLGLPMMGTEGAGLGTTLALYLGSVIHIVQGWRVARDNGFMSRIPRLETMKAMLRLAIPTATQQFLFAAGFTALFWIVGQMGSAEVAALNVIINLALVAILPGIGLGLAALTLVGQALGRKDADDASRWAWEVSKVAFVAMAILAIPALAVPGIVLSGFTDDPKIVAVAENALRLIGATIMFDGVGLVLMHALLGAGGARQVMIIAVGSQWIVGLPLAWFVGPYLGLGLFAVWATQAGYRIFQAAAFVVIWRRRRWGRIEV